jgi:hypothetical protein
VAYPKLTNCEDGRMDYSRIFRMREVCRRWRFVVVGEGKGVDGDAYLNVLWVIWKRWKLVGILGVVGWE